MGKSQFGPQTGLSFHLLPALHPYCSRKKRSSAPKHFYPPYPSIRPGMEGVHGLEVDRGKGPKSKARIRLSCMYQWLQAFRETYKKGIHMVRDVRGL